MAGVDRPDEELVGQLGEPPSSPRPLPLVRCADGPLRGRLEPGDPSLIANVPERVRALARVGRSRVARGAMFPGSDAYFATSTARLSRITVTLT